MTPSHPAVGAGLVGRADASGPHPPVLTPDPAPAHRADDPSSPWWRHAVVYQVYPRSFADADGDGVGDLPGVTAHLPYLAGLGVDGIWLSPFYPSPQADAGYDVSDYRGVDPLFGTLADAAELVSRAHARGLKVLVDLVPNHSSDEHPWFQEALAAGPGSPERERYHFQAGRGPQGNEPPNNWESMFTGSAWTQVEVGDQATGAVGQWYLHLFDAKQPDWNWDNPQVRAEFEDVLRFWLDRGVDGFRVDVAHSLVKAAGLPDMARATGSAAPGQDGHPLAAAPMWDQDGVHEVYRSWRRLVEEYNPGGAARDGDADRILCAEAWVTPVERAVRYVRPDEMHQAFNFDLLQTAWRAGDLRAVITASFQAADSVDAPTTWVLSNHDVMRHASRLGYPPSARLPHGVGAGDRQPNQALGLRRARAATTLMLALPGSAYLYQGEELGLPEHTELPDEARQDPVWRRSGGVERGRDGCRVPMPWEAAAPGLGFSSTGRTWLPQPSSYRPLAVDQQANVVGSTLELYRALLARRALSGLGEGSLTWLRGYDERHVVAFEVTGRATVRVVANLGRAAVPLPERADVLVASGPLDRHGRLPADTTVWLAGR